MPAWWTKASDISRRNRVPRSGIASSIQVLHRLDHVLERVLRLVIEVDLKVR